MNENNKVAIIVGIIGLVGTISAAVIGAMGGSAHAENKQNKYFQSQVANIEGDNNNVTINDVNDLINEYNSLLSENELLKEKNTSYFNDLTETKNKLVSLENQIGDIPQISYKNLGLTIDAEDISINKNNSMVTIDGREYFSKEIVKKLISDDKNITIRDNTIFIGTVIAEKASLINKRKMTSNYCDIGKNLTNSYGDTYSNTLYLNKNGKIIYILDEKYSLMKFTISISENAYMSQKGIVIIKADENVVYTSPSLNKKTEPFTEVDIPINNCKLLTIIYETNSNYNNCIIADAIVYN